jgi:hypothetical protein
MKAIFDALPDPTDPETLWLLNQGIDVDALCFSWPIRGASVRWSDSTSFDFDTEGDRAVIFRAEDRGEVVDLIAWSPRTGNIGSWHGAAVCLGDFDQIDNPAIYAFGDGIEVHPDPLAWLRNNRSGIVVIKPGLYQALAHRPRLVVDNPRWGRKVKQSIQPPKPTARILVKTDGRGQEVAA